MKRLFKRLNAFVIASVILCGAVAAGFFTPEKKHLKAYANSWSDYITVSSFAGDGSVTNPYLIGSAEQLALMAQRVNTNTTDYNKAFYKLNYTTINKGVIDLSEHDFAPIGKSTLSYDGDAKFNKDTAVFDNIDTVFMGHFNGEYFIGNERKFFEIRGLNGGALFGATDSAYIRNFDLTEVDIDLTEEDINSIGAHCGAVVNAGIDTEVRNVSVGRTDIVKGLDSSEKPIYTESSYIKSSGDTLGGIMGYGVRSSVFACENYATIESTAVISQLGLDAIPKAGGLAGAMVKGGLGDCINEGAVTGYCAGGIMGYGMQASINRTINAGVAEGSEYKGEFIGRFNTVNSAPTESLLALLPFAETSTCIAEAGALIKDSFFNTDKAGGVSSGTLITGADGTENGLIGVINNPGQDYIRVKALDTVRMTGRMQQKLNMSDLRDDALITPSNQLPDLLFKKWWEYNDAGLPRPIRWEMWVDKAEPASFLATDTATLILSAEKLAYLAYVVNRGLLGENEQRYLQMGYTGNGTPGVPYQNGNIDIGGKLWIPFGTMKNPFMGENFKGIEPSSFKQSFISNMTINSALSYQSFFGVVKQRPDKEAATKTYATLKVNNIHLAGVDVWSGSIDMTAGFVSLYNIAEVSQNTTTPALTVPKYYRFQNCITSGLIKAYGNTVGLTAGFTGLVNNTAIMASAIIVGQSGNAADITSYAANACGLVYNLSSIISKDTPQRYGVLDSFNTGDISSFKLYGIASGLISYVDGTKSLTIRTSYNAGKLIGGVKANYAGDIIGSSGLINFTNCYYRCYQSGAYTDEDEDTKNYVAANRPAGGTTNIGTGLPLGRMKGTGTNFSTSAMTQLQATVTNWGIYEWCNKSCPIGVNSIAFYNINVDYKKHDGDVIIETKVVEAKISEIDFACRTSILKAYPISGNDNDFDFWKIPEIVEGQYREEPLIEYETEVLAKPSVNFRAELSPMNSLTVVSSNLSDKSIDIPKEEINTSKSYNSVCDTDVGKVRIFTWIFQSAVSGEDDPPPPISFKVTTEDDSFEGWYEWENKENEVTDNDDDESVYTLNLTFPANVSSDRMLYAKFGVVFTISATLKVAIGNVLKGITTGGGSYRQGDTATIHAFADKGYRFTGWYDDSGKFVSGDAEYTFTVLRNVKFTPRFERDRYAEAAALSAWGGAFILLSFGLFCALITFKRYGRLKS